MPFYGDIFWVNFFDLKNSKNLQNNGNLEPLKDFVTVLFLFTFFNLILDAPRNFSMSFYL